MEANQWEISPQMLAWSASAIYCHDSGQDCNNCGSRINNCQMPRVLVAMRAARVPLPSDKVRRQAFEERCLDPFKRSMLLIEEPGHLAG